MEPSYDGSIYIIMKKTKILILLVLLTTLFSCVSTDSGVELFINKEKHVKYFFPSRKWVSNIDNITLKADWLYRDYSLENEEQPRTILNFTLSSKKQLFRETPDHLLLSSNNFDILIPREHIRLIYMDRGKTRYSAWIPSSKMNELIINTVDEIYISFNLKSDHKFSSPKSFDAHIDYYKEVLLGLDLIK